MGLLCTACGKKEVNYEVDTIEEATATDAHYGDEASAAFIDEELKIDESTVVISAETMFPESGVNTYNASACYMDERTKEDFVNRMSQDPDDKVYNYEEQVKEMLKYDLLEYEMELKNGVYEIDQSELYIERIENAPDDWEEVEDYTSDYYVIKKNNVDYSLMFNDRGFSFFPFELLQYFERKGIDAGYQSVRKDFDYDINFDVSDANMEKYVNSAKEIINILNLGEFEAVRGYEGKYIGQYYDDEKQGIHEDELDKGYSITFHRKLDNYIVDGNSDYIDKIFTSRDELHSFRNSPRDCFEMIEIELDSECNLTNIYYQGALSNVVKDKENVNLIEFSKVKDAIINELIKNPRRDITGYKAPENDALKYSDYAPITYWNNLTFKYVRLSYEKEGSYAIVPVWCLKGAVEGDELYSGYSVVMVNALDGSIIYLSDEMKME